MACRTRGEIRQQIMDRLGLEEQNEPRTVRVINGAIDGSQAALLAIKDWEWLEDIVRLPITSATTRILLPDGVTVLDSDGVVAPYVRNVFHVELVSTGRALGHEDRIVDSFMNDALGYRARGMPATWGTWGRYLYVAPLPAGADALDLFAVRGHAPLVSDLAEPLVPHDFRQFHVEDVLATVWSTDGQDVRKQARARDNARTILAGIYQFSAPAKPRLKNIPVLPFQT